MSLVFPRAVLFHFASVIFHTVTYFDATKMLRGESFWQPSENFPETIQSISLSVYLPPSPSYSQRNNEMETRRNRISDGMQLAKRVFNKASNKSFQKIGELATSTWNLCFYFCARTRTRSRAHHNCRDIAAFHISWRIRSRQGAFKWINEFNVHAACSTSSWFHE